MGNKNNRKARNAKAREAAAEEAQAREAAAEEAQAREAEEEQRRVEEQKKRYIAAALERSKRQKVYRTMPRYSKWSDTARMVTQNFGFMIAPTWTFYCLKVSYNKMTEVTRVDLEKQGNEPQESIPVKQLCEPVVGRKLNDEGLFPMRAIFTEEENLKFTASLSPDSPDTFILLMDGVPYAQHPFRDLRTNPNDLKLRGGIKLNGAVVLGHNPTTMEWNYLQFQAMCEANFGGPLFSILMHQINCSTGVMNEMIDALLPSIHDGELREINFSDWRGMALDQGPFDAIAECSSNLETLRFSYMTHDSVTPETRAVLVNMLVSILEQHALLRLTELNLLILTNEPAEIEQVSDALFTKNLPSLRILRLRGTPAWWKKESIFSKLIEFLGGQYLPQLKELYFNFNYLSRSQSEQLMATLAQAPFLHCIKGITLCDNTHNEWSNQACIDLAALIDRATGLQYLHNYRGNIKSTLRVDYKPARAGADGIVADADLGYIKVEWDGRVIHRMQTQRTTEIEVRTH